MATDHDNDDALSLDTMFPDPPTPPPPPPTYSIYTRKPPSIDITIRLTGSHPLWAHHLWNSSRSISRYFETPPNQHLFRSKNVLELGAGGALPSIVISTSRAGPPRKVVITDYPDEELLKNIQINIAENLAEIERERVVVLGYKWGQGTVDLMSVLDGENEQFDLIILSDLIFNHSQVRRSSISLSKD